jgi:hypothetical protein
MTRAAGDICSDAKFDPSARWRPRVIRARAADPLEAPSGDCTVNGYAAISSVRIWSILCSSAPCLKNHRFCRLAWLDARNPALYTSAVFTQTIDLTARRRALFFEEYVPCPGVAT